jgi:hypothetical protein
MRRGERVGLEGSLDISTRPEGSSQQPTTPAHCQQAAAVAPAPIVEPLFRPPLQISELQLVVWNSVGAGVIDLQHLESCCVVTCAFISSMCQQQSASHPLATSTHPNHYGHR